MPHMSACAVHIMETCVRMRWAWLERCTACLMSCAGGARARPGARGYRLTRVCQGFMWVA